MQDAATRKPDLSTARSSGSDSEGIDGETGLQVRIFGLFIAGLVMLALVLGAWRGLSNPHGGIVALVDGLKLTQVVLAIALILLGSIVEGFGYGLSLGTRWPYTRNIVVLMVRGDPEAAHRLVATLVGIVALLLAFLAPASTTIGGLVLVVVTALFGMGTLYVLAGRAPAVVHGIHGLLAYCVFLVYLIGLTAPSVNFWHLLAGTAALHALLLTVFLGGMTTGQRGFGQAIGAFYKPERAAHWIVAAHVLSALLLIGTLGWLMPAYPLAFYLALGQVAVGFMLFHAVNLRPRAPGAVVAFHQGMVLLITMAIVLH